MKRFKSSALCIASAAALGLLPLTSCDQSKEKLQETQQANVELSGQLQETLATQDSLFALINDITDGMAQIKEIERIVATSSSLSAESPSRKDQLRADMAALQQALQQRRERLEELEKRLKEVSGKPCH